MITTNKIYIDRDTELDEKKLSKIMQRFRDGCLPELVFRRGYYDGTGQAIMKKVSKDNLNKPNNRIVKNYCKSCVENFRGYITGIPITYTAKNPDEDITVLLDTLRDNDVVNSDSEWLKNALIYGVAPQLCYINEKQEKRFRNISPESVIPVYSADLDEELLYVIYFYPVVDWDKDEWDSKYSVNVYDATNIYHYTSTDGFNSFTIEEPESHHFGEVPFSIFYLNDDGTSVFDCIIGLQDAYNNLLSSSINDWEAFCDAYMVTKNGKIDEEDIEQMRTNRVISSSDDMDVYYLTKNTNDTQVMNLLEEVNKAIHTIANSPDFSSEEFGSGVSSGVALAYKLVGFSNIATNIEAQFKKAIGKRIDLLNKVYTLVDTNSYEVEIAFTHNLPTNIADTAQTINQLRGLVSNETLLSQIPFISDVQQELERMEAQKESENEAAAASLYNFSMAGDEDEAV